MTSFHSCSPGLGALTNQTSKRGQTFFSSTYQRILRDGQKLPVGVVKAERQFGRTVGAEQVWTFVNIKT